MAPSDHPDEAGDAFAVDRSNVPSVCTLPV
ncbi:hypothetical protein XHV734_3296 [Xanthomonas hortorum pv. vitians]|nr:hypothetical protein XHV734_3296 [Xanthomonas hortorum pv. vitians]